MEVYKDHAVNVISARQYFEFAVSCFILEMSLVYISICFCFFSTHKWSWGESTVLFLLLHLPANTCDFNLSLVLHYKATPNWPKVATKWWQFLLWYRAVAVSARRPADLTEISRSFIKLFQGILWYAEPTNASSFYFFSNTTGFPFDDI
jgi:hypothetical protein